MKIATMKDLYVSMLKDMYYAEKKLTKALPKLAKKSTAMELKSAFESHLEETLEHVARLEKVFALVGIPAKAEKCPAIDGIVEETENTIEECTDKKVCDAAIIAMAQKAEHYEISTYGTLVAFAKTLGYKDQAAILQKTLDEEKSADSTLSELAQSDINSTATAASSSKKAA
jgi:ferritin-like metal-binding protein YciE